LVGNSEGQRGEREVREVAGKKPSAKAAREGPLSGRIKKGGRGQAGNQKQSAGGNEEGKANYEGGWGAKDKYRKS